MQAAEREGLLLSLARTWPGRAGVKELAAEKENESMTNGRHRRFCSRWCSLLLFICRFRTRHSIS